MNEIVNFSAAKIFILNELDRLSPALTYHGKHHTLDVVAVAERLCAVEKVSKRDTTIVLTAAFLHDIGFLRHYGLEKDFKMNIEVNHATLAGHTFQHELQVSADAGMLGSIDANRGDYQNGWDTDQFPNNLTEITEALIVFLEAGGLKTGGVNFDAKTRRNSTDLDDIFLAHIGGMDTFARALVAADAVLTKTPYRKIRTDRYASFDSGAGKDFENGKLSLVDLRNLGANSPEPKQVSGKQEWLENIINDCI